MTGGKQGLFDRSKPEWHRYAEARVVILDPASGRAEVALRYEARREHRPDDDPSLTFKAASLDGDGLLVTDLTEVLVLDHQLAVRDVVSHPCFNDLHHVARIDGRLHVVSTGLDSLVVLDADHAVSSVRHALGKQTWELFDRTVDYRLLPTTKPHRSHPNFVFADDRGTWLTRFEQRDAVCLDDPSLRIDIAVGNPHDGVRRGDAIWFTTTNGHLVEADRVRCTVRRRIDLNEVDGRGGPLGWCRGLHLDGEIAYVGFTKLRRTRIAANVRWVKERFSVDTKPEAMPTRITAYDLARLERVAEWELDGAGLDTVFSILPWP